MHFLEIFDKTFFQYLRSSIITFQCFLMPFWKKSEPEQSSVKNETKIDCFGFYDFFVNFLQQLVFNNCGQNLWKMHGKYLLSMQN